MKEKDIKRDGISRRDFLKGSAVALASTLPRLPVLGQELSDKEKYERESKDLKKLGIENVAFLQDAKARVQYIDYNPPYLERGSELERVLDILERYQKEISVVLGMSASDVVDLKLGESVKYIKDRQVKAKSLKQSYWNEIASILGTTEEYSQDGFSNFLISELPKYFAKYGIFTKTQNLELKDYKNDVLFFAEPILLLQDVKEATNDTFTIDGNEHERHVIKVEDRDYGSNEVYKKIFPDMSTAEWYKNNIIIFSDAFKDTLKSVQEDSKEASTRFGSATKEQVNWNDYDEQNKRVYSIAIALGAISNDLRDSVTSEVLLSNIIIHESGHQRDYDLRKEYLLSLPSASAPISEFSRYKTVDIVNREIAAHLHELRYSPSKLILVASALRSYMDPELSSVYFTHDPAGNDRNEGGNKRAYKWIAEHMVSLIEQRPDYFGFNEDQNLTLLSKRNQIVIFLSEVAKSDDLLIEIADKLISLHQSAPYGTTKEETEEVMQEMNSLKSELTAGVVAVSVIAGSAYLAKKAKDVYSKVKACRELKRGIDENNTLSGDTKKELILGLQLESNSNIDEERRQSSIRKLVHLSESDTSLVELVEKATPLFAEKTKRRASETKTK
ncbi:MAG: hypothetical protein COV07_00780 [Candidatus Vogelbacteria bacterium CG10_big_fil_rev_8_21_14_0_10_45_14]|uniref:Twin-arginine translocation signal domain-containing protein n=1 Tax=Candidatus Vogelbacteria bacterium CG10_big_fil_rev_8_21_14_0_10_45_14 TaxID=1975042 RepID=A0A2H0RKN4_9BACT|nr:MAG: hypothetical protein COV07_00780 [Candidatus Vogelbacteria bacterium CG10_big_fil_rev_8_21_14_0_10_45_14]